MSSLTKLSALCSDESVIPDDALFALKSCLNVHQEF